MEFELIKSDETFEYWSKFTSENMIATDERYIVIKGDTDVVTYGRAFFEIVETNGGFDYDVEYTIENEKGDRKIINFEGLPPELMEHIQVEGEYINIHTKDGSYWLRYVEKEDVYAIYQEDRLIGDIVQVEDKWMTKDGKTSDTIDIIGKAIEEDIEEKRY